MQPDRVRKSVFNLADHTYCWAARAEIDLKLPHLDLVAGRVPARPQFERIPLGDLLPKQIGIGRDQIVFVAAILPSNGRALDCIALTILRIVDVERRVPVVAAILTEAGNLSDDITGFLAPTLKIRHVGALAGSQIVDQSPNCFVSILALLLGTFTRHSRDPFGTICSRYGR